MVGRTTEKKQHDFFSFGRGGPNILVFAFHCFGTSGMGKSRARMGKQKELDFSEILGCI